MGAEEVGVGAAGPWWRDAVVYQIYPRSFCDTSGDGIGDLAGITAHLDHLAWLGVDALWLSPIYRSPMADFGYDVACHTDVDPRFGTLEDAETLIDAAHERGLRVLLDFVPNHTSSAHPWFVAARSGQGPRDWYVWRDPAPDGGPPNHWVATFDPTRPAWTFDEGSGQYYLHLFLPEQPDLDWNHPGVVEAQHDVLRFWLDRGVDGFRADVVHLIGKDPALADDPRDLAGEVRVGFHFEPDRLLPLLRGLRRTIDSHIEPGAAQPRERVIVGEVNLSRPEDLIACADGGHGLHLVFNFALLRAPWDAEAWRQVLAEVSAAADPAGAWPTWVLSNHDEPRHRTRYGSLARARAAAVVLLTLRGTPFLYAGEELGLADAVITEPLDPGGRDGCRAPLPWHPEPPHGWAATPWLPWPPEPDRHAVSAQRSDPASTLTLYRRLLHLRRARTVLREGGMRLLEAPGVCAYERHLDEDRLIIALGTDPEARLDLTGSWRTLLASDARDEGAPFDGHVGADRAVILSPAEPGRDGG